MTNILTEQFNQNRDLVSLVWYLINTYKSLKIIYNFSRVKIHSVKAISQVINIDATFPVELQVYFMKNLNNALYIIFNYSVI